MKNNLKKKIFLIILLILGLFISIRFCFPFVFEKEIYSKELFLEEGRVLIISDLHLDRNSRDLNCIGDYLEKSNISYLILNGDLFDKLHRKKFEDKFLIEIKQRLGIKNYSELKIIYILALYNHDPHFKENIKESKESLILRGILKLKTGDDLFYIFHGDYAASNGIGIMSLANKITSKLLFERLAKNAIKAENNNWVILGHSHIPGIDYERKLANSGTWIKRIVSNTDTGILIEFKNGSTTEVNLIKIPCQ